MYGKVSRHLSERLCKVFIPSCDLTCVSRAKVWSSISVVLCFPFQRGLTLTPSVSWQLYRSSSERVLWPGVTRCDSVINLSFTKLTGEPRERAFLSCASGFSLSGCFNSRSLQQSPFIVFNGSIGATRVIQDWGIFAYSTLTRKLSWDFLFCIVYVAGSDQYCVIFCKHNGDKINKDYYFWPLVHIIRKTEKPILIFFSGFTI